MFFILLFVLGLVFGSFGYVLALRYDGDHFLLDPKTVGGRSYCPSCGATLRWFELIPVVSFLIQRGQCRNCKARIGFAYPIIELLSGLLFVAVGMRVQAFYGIAGGGLWIFDALWIAFFFALALLSVIDIRLGIIPDEISIFLTAVAILLVGFSASYFGSVNVSFFGPYASVFGVQENVWSSHIIGAVIGFLFFAGLVAFTRGKGMGLGDVKLALPLGFLFGWPDIIFLTGAAFVTGAATGLFFIARGKKTMKSALPFGPFLAVGAVLVFFAGSAFMHWYIRAMGL